MWDRKAQAQLLQVSPFVPRRRREGAPPLDAAVGDAQEMAAQMERVQVLPASCFASRSSVECVAAHSPLACCCWRMQRHRNHRPCCMIRQHMNILMPVFWLQLAIQDLRSRIYWGLNEILTPAVQVRDWLAGILFRPMPGLKIRFGITCT